MYRSYAKVRLLTLPLFLQPDSDSDSTEERLQKLVMVKRSGKRPGIRCNHKSCRGKNKFVQKIERHYKDRHADDLPRWKKLQRNAGKVKAYVKVGKLKEYFPTLIKKPRFVKEFRAFCEGNKIVVVDEPAADSESSETEEQPAPDPAPAVSINHLREDKA